MSAELATSRPKLVRFSYFRPGNVLLRRRGTAHLVAVRMFRAAPVAQASGATPKMKQGGRHKTRSHCAYCGPSRPRVYCHPAVRAHRCGQQRHYAFQRRQVFARAGVPRPLDVSARNSPMSLFASARVWQSAMASSYRAGISSSIA
jgi:hypothetical protein